MFPCALVFDGAHSADEAKLACRCGPGNYLPPVSKPWGYCCAEPCWVFKVGSGVDLRSPGLHSKCFTDEATSPDSQLYNDAEVTGLQENIYLEFRVWSSYRLALCSAELLQCWAAVSHTGPSQPCDYQHSIVCRGAEVCLTFGRLLWCMQLGVTMFSTFIGSIGMQVHQKSRNTSRK